MLATVFTRAGVGIEAPQVTVEVHTGGGLPRFLLVGLAEAVVRESRERVRSALKNSNYTFPQGRLTVNLAPADIPKHGGRFDLPIAIGILGAQGKLSLPESLSCEFYGELGLGGELRPFRGALPAAVACRDAGRSIILPRANAHEAALVEGGRVLPADTLLDVCAHLAGITPLAPYTLAPQVRCSVGYPDLADVRGQHHARRSLEIAAAGGHSILFCGPPGTGKSMLAARLPGVLPRLDVDEALETAAITSISTSGFHSYQWLARPFRSPHHTASGIALVGGGSPPKPGEISLAHNGVLFLDELPEFSRQVLEVLRQPIEDGSVIISRAAMQTRFPCKFQLVAAMNPCPCGYLGDPLSDCHCSADRVQAYRHRISGPLLDRIDIQIHVPRPGKELLRPDALPGESSATVASRVQQARGVQVERAGCFNARLHGEALTRHCMPEADGLALLDEAMDQFGLSARAYQRVLRVARTVADLAGAERVAQAHIGEAIGLRKLDQHTRIS